MKCSEMIALLGSIVKYSIVYAEFITACGDPLKSVCSNSLPLITNSNICW